MHSINAAFLLICDLGRFSDQNSFCEFIVWVSQRDDTARSGSGVDSVSCMRLSFLMVAFRMIVAKKPWRAQSSKLMWASLLQEYVVEHGDEQAEELNLLAISAWTTYSESFSHNDMLINDAFFHSQVNPNSENAFFESEEAFMTLKTIAGEMFSDTMLTFFNKEVTQETIDAIFCWATVGGKSTNSFHPPHSHKNSVLSGVFYSSVPESGSAPITFADPRGKFQTVHSHSPKKNSFLVFPSWLEHFVGPSDSTDFRVSYSCNLPGTWEETSDLNLEL